MDNIDIIDSTFSLENTTSMIGGENFDYSPFIYLAIAIFGVFFGMYIYNTYLKKSSTLDCEGGFCTMENRDHCEPDNQPANKAPN